MEENAAHDGGRFGNENSVSEKPPWQGPPPTPSERSLPPASSYLHHPDADGNINTEEEEKEEKYPVKCKLHLITLDLCLVVFVFALVKIDSALSPSSFATHVNPLFKMNNTHSDIVGPNYHYHRDT